jgi:hypothetical protein
MAPNYLNMLYIVAALIMIFAILNFLLFNYKHFGAIKFQLQPAFSFACYFQKKKINLALLKLSYFLWGTKPSN